MRCQCKGHIVSAAAWTINRWDWRPIFGSFAHNVRPMDIDFLVERNGRFLVLETKSGAADLPRGQAMALEAMARIPQFTVAAVWGEPDEPTHISECVRGIWQPRTPFTAKELWNYAADWWTRVDRGRAHSA